VPSLSEVPSGGEFKLSSAAGRNLSYFRRRSGARQARGAVERRRLPCQPIRIRLNSIMRFEGRQARPANAEFDWPRRDLVRHHLGRRRELGTFADRLWRILYGSIDLAIGDTGTYQNNESDNGDKRAKTSERAKIGLIQH